MFMIYYIQFSQRHVSAAIAAIFRVKLLQDCKSTNVIRCVVVTP